jgi:hypothetical protein
MNAAETTHDRVFILWSILPWSWFMVCRNEGYGSNIPKSARVSALILGEGQACMADNDQLLDATTALVPPLLSAMDALRAAGRHMHPTSLPELVAAIRPQQQGPR